MTFHLSEQDSAIGGIKFKRSGSDYKNIPVLLNDMEHTKKQLMQVIIP